MEGFRQFLNEMYVSREKGGTLVIAFRQWLWVVTRDNPDVLHIADAIAGVNPHGVDLLGHIRDVDAESISQWVNEYIPDALVATWDQRSRTLWMHGGNMGLSPTSSPLVRKVALELGARKVQYEAHAGERETTVSKGRKQLKGNWDVTWYHGTSSRYVGRILSLGIKPGESDSNYADQGIVHDESVFLSAKLDEAQYHAFHTVRKKGGIPVVLVVDRIPDKSLLEPDYDVDAAASQSHYNVRPRRDYDAAFAADSMSASKHVGLVGYKGRIPATHISAVLIHTEHGENWRRVKDLARLKKALDRYGEDFWYRYGEPASPSRSRY